MGSCSTMVHQKHMGERLETLGSSDRGLNHSRLTEVSTSLDSVIIITTTFTPLNLSLKTFKSNMKCVLKLNHNHVFAAIFKKK